jgi:hypothetical protein
MHYFNACRRSSGALPACALPLQLGSTSETLARLYLKFAAPALGIAEYSGEWTVLVPLTVRIAG